MAGNETTESFIEYLSWGILIFTGIGLAIYLFLVVAAPKILAAILASFL